VAVRVAIGLLLDAVDFRLPILGERHIGGMAIEETPRQTKRSITKYGREGSRDDLRVVKLLATRCSQALRQVRSIASRNCGESRLLQRFLALASLASSAAKTCETREVAATACQPFLVCRVLPGLESGLRKISNCNQASHNRSSKSDAQCYRQWSVSWTMMSICAHAKFNHNQRFVSKSRGTTTINFIH
jgi:hypothetical protein